MSLVNREKLAKRELARRKIRSIQQRKLDVLASTFAQQRAFIVDPARLKVAFCTRRAAKSYTGGLYAFKTALENEHAKVLYIALTRDSARLIWWADVLKAIHRKYPQIEVRFNETLLEARFSNGAMIKLLGMDSNEDEKQKALGQKYKLVLIDEAASFTIDLQELVYKILKPAVMDLRGTICLLGTPGNLTKGLFFEVTNRSYPDKGWSVHKWHTLDNPYTREQYLEEIADIERDRPLFKETAAFKQMYLGLWAIEEDAMVYRFKRSKNMRAMGLPTDRRYRWTYVLGVDLGYEDDTAFAVLAYSPTAAKTYVVHVYKQKHMDLTDVGKKYHELNSRFGFEFAICDGANKQAVMELNNRHGTDLHAADKAGKQDFIQLLNDEYIQEKVELLPDAEPLALEYEQLIWQYKEKTREEHPNLPNHACDAVLYPWRFTYTYLSKAPEKEPEHGSEAYWQAEEEAQLQARIRRIKSDSDDPITYPTHYR